MTVWCAVWALGLHPVRATGPPNADASIDASLRRLSTRELYALARKLGVEDELPKRQRGAVEKPEIVAVLREVVAHDRARQRRKTRQRRAQYVALAVGAVGVAAFAWEPVSRFVASASRVAAGHVRHRVDLARYAARSGSPEAACGIFVCALIELGALLVRWSVVASWLVPRTWWRTRRLLLTSHIPSIPVDPLAALQRSLSTTSSSGNASSSWSYNVDVAPVLLLWILARLQRRVERWVGRRMRDAAHSAAAG